MPLIKLSDTEMKTLKIFYALTITVIVVTLFSASTRGTSPLGQLGYEIADSIEVIINEYESYDVEFCDRRRLAMLRAKSNDTIYGSSWASSGPIDGLPHSYIFWNTEDTISFAGGNAVPPFAASMPDIKTAIKNTKIALSGVEYNPDELGYFITYVIILKDGKFTITSGRGNPNHGPSNVIYY